MAVSLQKIFTHCKEDNCPCQYYNSGEKDGEGDLNSLCTDCNHTKGNHNQAMFNTTTNMFVSAAVITPASLDSTITTPSGIVAVPGTTIPSSSPSSHGYSFPLSSPSSFRNDSSYLHGSLNYNNMAMSMNSVNDSTSITIN